MAATNKKLLCLLLVGLTLFGTASAKSKKKNKSGFTASEQKAKMKRASTATVRNPAGSSLNGKKITRIMFKNTKL